MKSSFLIPESFFNNSKYNRKIINISFWLSEILNLWKRCLGGCGTLAQLRSLKRNEDDCLQDVNSEPSRSLSLAENPMFVHLRINSVKRNFKLNLLLYIALELFSSSGKNQYR